jgi:hypothetical protein
MDDRHKLLTELRAARRRTSKYGWHHYVLAYIVASIAVAGSIAATIFATQGGKPLVTAILAAIPGAAVAFNATFHFEQKAFWHWRTTKRFDGLIRRLEYENAKVADVSRDFSTADVETFDGWMVHSSLSGEQGSEARKPQ